MFSRRSCDQQDNDTAHVRCFSFSKKKLTSSTAVDRTDADLPSDLFCAPRSENLSVASCSLSCVAAVPEVTPLHLDIPYVAASPASHSDTLASIERFDSPRVSHCGPISEAGRAFVAARKHSMRQEHLAAIANLNTFAKKRANKSPKSSSCSDSSSAAGRLSTPSTTDNGQLQMSRNAAAAAHSPAALDRVQVTTEANWSDKPLLACGPTATPAERAHSKSDVGSANGAEQAGSSASKQHQQASVGAGPATLEGGCIANSKAVATLHCRTDQPWKQVATRCSPHPTAHDTVYGVATPAAAPPSAICQGKAPVACASLASMSTSTSVTCHQDNSTVVHTASTSSCSSCTNADSVGSNACSTAHHDEANANLSQRLQAPQSKEKTASSEATDVHLAKEEQASAPSQKGPMTCQGPPFSQEADFASNPACVQALPTKNRNPDPQASLASRESSPDESLIAEGWIVAGTIMSNKDCKPDVASAASVADPTLDASAALPQKTAISSPAGVVPRPALSTDEIAQLTEELEVLKEQPRAQMTSQQLGRYLDIKIKLGRAGSMSCKSAVQQPALQVRPAVHAGNKLPLRPSPAPCSASTDRSRAKPVSKAAVVPKKTDATSSGRPAKRAAENSASSGRHIPAYMKATASVKAKDARDQQAKIAASRTALAEKKWNRA